MHQARHLQGSFHSNVPGVRNGEMELFARHLKTRCGAEGVMRKIVDSGMMVEKMFFSKAMVVTCHKRVLT